MCREINLENCRQLLFWKSDRSDRKLFSKNKDDNMFGFSFSIERIQQFILEALLSIGKNYILFIVGLQ